MTVTRNAALMAVAMLALPACALAQSQPAPTDAPSDMTTPPSAMTPSAPAAGVNTNAVRRDASQFPPAQAQALAMGDNALVTNGPVPDTAENRAKYGQPLSHAGKASAPEGN